ncbi:Cytochrome c-type biogenesis protein CcsA/ResC [Olavius sp. associated proteobacterium Delta 1]|nr:Cytochrome c-type biogenesis protein CcsA/ResC [Olavius sp. associated proteobacterium Delta 1]
MSGSFVLSIVTFVYGLAGFLYISAWIFRKQLFGRVATWIALIGLIGNTAGILMRWVESYQLGIGHAPFSNLYESLVFFAWVIVLIYLIVERKIGNRIIGAFTTPIACLVMAYASLKPGIPSTIQPLIPALKSNWLIAHVITCFIGYAAFALAFGISAMYLMRRGRDDEEILWLKITRFLVLFVFAALFSRVLFVHNWLLAFTVAIPICLVFFVIVFLVHKMPAESKTRLLDRFPEARVLDELGYQLILLGFLFLSIGIISGAVWANSAWGRYWGWDPKETWSLITWFVYATLLHARMTRGWHGKRIAYLSMFGFAAVIFTYFGVNLLPGLHSYGAF